MNHPHNKLNRRLASRLDADSMFVCAPPVAGAGIDIIIVVPPTGGAAPGLS